MAARSTYNTRQRKAVHDFLVSHADRYLSVEEVYDSLRERGAEVGRTTAYRTLEALADEGVVSKVLAPRGGECRYRLIEPGHEDAGQFVCVDCGRVEPIECEEFQEFFHHIRTDHGFAIEPSRTVLYGHCPSCVDEGPESHA